MKRKIQLSALLLFCLLAASPLNAQDSDFVIDGFYYSIENDHEVSIGCENEQTIVNYVVPSTVEYSGETYTVTRIRNMRWEALETVVIPSTVKRIEGGAFAENANLRTVTIDEGCEYIGSGAFSECYMLKQIHLPNSLKETGDDFLSMCASLEEIHLPKNVLLTERFGTLNGTVSLGFLPGLKYISVDEENPYYKSVAGILFAKYDSDTYEQLAGAYILKHYPAQLNLENAENPEDRRAMAGYMIPGNANYISMEAFSGYRFLKHITIPSNYYFAAGGVFMVMFDYAFCYLGGDFQEFLNMYEAIGMDMTLPVNEIKTITMPVNYMYRTLAFSHFCPMDNIVFLSNLTDAWKSDLSYWSTAFIGDQIGVHYVKNSFYNDTYDWLIESGNMNFGEEENPKEKYKETLRLDYKIPFTMNSSGYATFCRDFDANFGFEEFAEDNTDLKVYVASSVADTVVTLKEIGDKYIPSRTGTDNYDFHGVLLKGTPGKTYYFTIGEQDYASGEQNTHEELMSGNLLVGCPVETYLLNRDEDEQAVFVLKNGKFQYLLDDMGVFSAQKAYLSLPRSQVQDIIDATRNHQTAAGAKLAMRFENADGTTETDGIEQVAAGLRDGESDVLYDLQGRRVETVPSHGIYVRNGQKVMIK